MIRRQCTEIFPICKPHFSLEFSLEGAVLPLALVTTFVYTISATISPLSHAEDADDLGPGIPPESFPFPSRGPTQERSLRRDAPPRARRRDHPPPTEKEDAETVEGRTAQGSAGSRGAMGERRVLHAGGGRAYARSSFRIDYTEKAWKELHRLPQATAARIFQKMNWFVAQEDPLAFAKRLRHEQAIRWRFRIGDYRVICSVIDDHVRVLRVLAVRDRGEVYRELE